METLVVRPRTGSGRPAFAFLPACLCSASGTGYETHSSPRGPFRAGGNGARAGRFCPGLPLRAGALVLQHAQAVHLAGEPKVAVEPLRREVSLLDRGGHRAARISRVAAVGVPARGGELFDVREGAGDALLRVPQLELAHSRRIEQEPAVEKEEQVAPGGGAAPPLV